MQIAMFSLHSSPIGALGTRYTGGMSVYIRELAREIGRRGHPTDIYTRRRHSGDPAVIRLSSNVRLIQLPDVHYGESSNATLYDRLPALFREIERFRRERQARYDIVHSHYWLSGRVGAWAQRRWQVPHLMMFHTLGAVKRETGVGKPEPPLRIATERQLTESCRKIVVAARREKDHLIRSYGADAGKIAVIPCGVDLHRFRPLDKIQARRRLGFQSGESLLLYVGRFAAVKGIDRLLEAVALLADRPGLRLIVVGGDGPDSPAARELRRKARELGIGARVVFAGRIEHTELPPYYSAADALILPSHYESFGLVALESLACGTPVVATAVGAMDAVIQPGVTGRMVGRSDPAQLAAAVEDLLTGAQGPHPSPEEIRRSVLGFGWTTVTESMLTEYSRIIDDRSDPTSRTLRSVSIK